MKKNLFVAALLLVAGLLNAQNQQKIDGVWYLLDSENKTATVTFCPTDESEGFVAESGYMGKLNIPATVAGEATGYMPYDVIAIGDSAFAKCPYLKSVIIPSSVKTLGLYLTAESYLNEYEKGIEAITISDGSEPIEFTYRQGDMGEEFSFQEIAPTCTYLYLGRNITVKTDADWDIPIFHTWGGIEEVVFGENFTEVPLAFCPFSRKLRSIQINSDNVLEPGPRMFAFLDEDKPQPDAKAITLYVPYGMKETYAAHEYWSRFTIEEMDDAQRYSIKYVPDKFDFFINGLYYKRTSRGVSVVIPQVWYIDKDGSYVSDWSSDFPYRQREINIPEQITLYLADYTTYSLTPKEGYEETTLEVAGIGDYCFREARNLEKLTIPNTVKEVGVEAFEYTDKLKSLDIPESVIHTGWLAFARAGFEEIVIPASCSKWEFNQGTAVFQECLNLRKVSFAKGTTRIPDRIFFGCTALRTVIIPDEVTEIGAGAFAGCSALSYLQLPASLEKIYNRTFHSCPLRELEIPAAVKEIEPAAFLATVFTKLKVDKNNTVFDSRDNCNAVIRTKDNTLLAACNGTFIPETVDSIAEEAFSELYGLRSVTLPKNLKKIASGAFMNCDNLAVITSHITNPAGILAENGFSSWSDEDAPCNKAVLYVPAGTKALYEADTEWKNFKNIIEMEGENKPADVADLKPVTEDGAADFGKIAGAADLSNTVIDNMYITCDKENGEGYDKTEKALVLNTVVDELMMQNILANEGNMDILRNLFSGIVIEIPAGKGTITIEAKVTGERALAVFISGTEDALTYEPATKTQIEVPYETAKNALVYLYGIFMPEEQSAAPKRVPSKILRAPKAGEDEAVANNVTVYGVSWNVTEVVSGIEEVEGQMSEAGSRKIIRNGRVLILREGRTYDLIGAEVK